MQCFRNFLNCAVCKGSDVRLSTGTLSDPRSWPRTSIDPHRWKWRVVLSFGLAHDHINLQEIQAALATFRWRCRSAQNVGTRFLHLSDSQVVISALSKGRSSSRRLNQLLKRTSSLLLAASLQPSMAYVRSEDNPADRPSRWRVRLRGKI